MTPALRNASAWTWLQQAGTDWARGTKAAESFSNWKGTENLIGPINAASHPRMIHVMAPISPFDPGSMGLLDDGDEEPRARRRKRPVRVPESRVMVLALAAISFVVVATVAIRIFGFGPLPLVMAAGLIVWMR